MILEAFVKLTMVSFVLVIPLICLNFPNDLIKVSGGDNFEKIVAIDEIFEPHQPGNLSYTMFESVQEALPDCALRDVVVENEFEEALLSNVIPLDDIGVRFDDVGALENVKKTLKELVMLPLQRPELIRK
ncbi:hypothetical protein RIF29_25015 [Crotalaria pallida]|uniref:Uncharacterized protein n=1 Tax=Crotalaria pallida TaxID=3830 RepID=A0AAN9ELJ8_CROPI